MSDGAKGQEKREREQKGLILFIVFLLCILVLLVLRDKIARKTVKFRPFEGEIETYNGSLHRNLSNPMGSE